MGYDFVIAEENRKNGIMSNAEKVEFPAKKYEIINKSEVSKGFVSNKDTSKASNVTTNNDKNSSNNIGSNNGTGSDPSYRESWKARNKAEQQNTMVFNFVNTKRDVTHIENDGLDLSKRKGVKTQLSKDPGVILLDPVGLGESTDGDSNDDDDDIGGNTTLPEESVQCNFTFIGANVISGKSSIRSKTKDKKLTITFKESLTEVFEYPSYESSLASPESNATSILNAKNTSIGGSFGGLGSYTPSKIQMDNGDNKFQLGVSRAIPNSNSSGTKTDSTSNGQKSSSNVNNMENSKHASNGKEDSVLLRPTEDAISWSGSSSSSDILF